MAEPLKLFFSYSHQDEALRKELGNHLRILEYQELITSWHDRKILPGDVWDNQITINQDTADIILLLISSDFIASRYCWDVEIRRAMELHESSKARVIPVILRSADWTTTPFGRLQAVPQNGQPVTNFPNRDDAYLFITQQIRQVATKLIEDRRRQQREIGIASYRQQFQEFVSDGEVSLGERFILSNIQRQHSLTDLEVQNIEQDILPTASRESLESYQQFFVGAIAQYEYPFSEEVRREATLVQHHLGLSDAEVAQVERAIVAQKEAESGQLTQSSSSPKRNPNRTYQELKEIAISNQVDELFSYLVEELLLHLAWAGTNRTSVTFSSKNNRKVLLSLNPVNSNSKIGLEFQIYAQRLAECLNTEVSNLMAMLPNYEVVWEAEWSGTVYKGFFKTLEEATHFTSQLKKL